MERTRRVTFLKKEWHNINWKMSGRILIHQLGIIYLIHTCIEHIQELDYFLSLNTIKGITRQILNHKFMQAMPELYWNGRLICHRKLRRWYLNNSPLKKLIVKHSARGELENYFSLVSSHKCIWCLIHIVLRKGSSIKLIFVMYNVCRKREKKDLTSLLVQLLASKYRWHVARAWYWPAGFFASEQQPDQASPRIGTLKWWEEVFLPHTARMAINFWEALVRRRYNRILHKEIMEIAPLPI